MGVGPICHWARGLSGCGVYGRRAWAPERASPERSQPRRCGWLAGARPRRADEGGRKEEPRRVRGTTEAGAQEHSASGRDHGEWASAGAAVVLAAAPQHSSSCCSSWQGTTRSGKWGDGVADAVVEQEGVRAWTGLERTGYGAWRARPQGRDGPEASGLHGREVDERGVRRRKEGERGGRGRGPHRRLQGHMGVEARGRPVGRRTGTIDGDGRQGSRGSEDPGGWLRRLDLQAAAIGVEGGSGMLPRSRSDREGGERRGEWGMGAVGS